MEFRPITDMELPKAKALWKQAFKDSDAYIDFNFKRNIDLEFSLGGFDKGDLATMLFMIRKTLACAHTGKVFEVYFIAGVATDEAYRRQGLASEILKKAYDFLYDRGVPVVYLYPFDHQFYKKQGFHTVSWMKKVTLKKSAFNKDEKSVTLKTYGRDELPDADVLLGLYSAYAKTKRSYFLRTRQDFIDMMDTLAVENGQVIIVSQNDKPVGYVLCYISQKKLDCTEVVFLNASGARAAVSLLAKEYSGFIYVDDAFEIENAETAEYAMMRIVNLKAAKHICGAASIEDVLGTEVMILEQY